MRIANLKICDSFQICSLLYIAHVMIHIMWKNKIDPDNAAIPFLTALGDLFGSCFLAIAFAFMISLGKPYIADDGADSTVNFSPFNNTLAWGE